MGYLQDAKKDKPEVKTAKGKEKGKDGKGDKNAKNADKEKQRKFIVRRVQQIFPSAVDLASVTRTRSIVCECILVI